MQDQGPEVLVPILLLLILDSIAKVGNVKSIFGGLQFPMLHGFPIS